MKNMPAKPKIAILGGGAVGLTYAAFLAPVADVVIKTRSQAQADHINAHGISLTLADKTEEITGMTATADMTDLKDCDAIVVALKTYDTEAIARELTKVIRQDVPVISLQNGLLAFEILKATIDNPNRVSAGLTYIGAKRSDDRSVGLGINRRTIIDAKAGPILDAFAKTRFGVEASDNIRQAVWDKMVLNDGQNALSAVTNLSVKQMLESPECIEIATHLLDELEAVGKAEGLVFNYSLLDKLKDNWGGGLDFYPSMWQDLHVGKRTEIDAINGAISELGKKHNIPTPYNDMITSLIKALESGTRSSES
ncbi:MAG TPA: 2-dehydropantoate 2-reductase [Candidatus Saccharimonadales bacterium]|nr:2-dehydropantoate 2-reductase [Candidatus Saccharimonadales bacterium]